MNSVLFVVAVMLISASSILIIAVGLLKDKVIVMLGLALATASTIALYSRHYSVARIVLHMFLIATLSILTTVITKKYLTTKT